LIDVAAELSQRLINIFVRDAHSDRPVNDSQNGKNQNLILMLTGKI
jgi:hypothetical protein